MHERDRGDRDPIQLAPPEALPEIVRAMGLLPSVACVLSAANEHRRAGILVSKVMPCADTPAAVAVAVPTGQRLAMLIRDTRRFGLSLLDPSAVSIIRKFDAFGAALGEHGPVSSGDPFDTLEVRTLATGVPLLARSVCVLECAVIRHLDLEADHELYVGVVIGAYSGSVGDGNADGAS